MMLNSLWNQSDNLTGISYDGNYSSSINFKYKHRKLLGRCKFLMKKCFQQFI